MTSDRIPVLRSIGDCTGYIRRREWFRTRTRETNYGTFTSMSGGRWVGAHGYLPREYWPSADLATYMVRSYDTPIAWWIPTPPSLDSRDVVESWLDGDEHGHWVMPTVKYTITTTSHQSEVRAALFNHGGPWRPGWTPREPLPVTELTVPGAPAKVPCGVERW